MPAQVLRFLMLNSDAREADLLYNEMTEWVAEKRKILQGIALGREEEGKEEVRPGPTVWRFGPDNRKGNMVVVNFGMRTNRSERRSGEPFDFTIVLRWHYTSRAVRSSTDDSEFAMPMPNLGSVPVGYNRPLSPGARHKSEVEALEK